MELKITEFDVNFSTISTNLITCVVNFSEQATKQLVEAREVIDTLKSENKKLTEQITLLTPVKAQASETKEPE